VAVDASDPLTEDDSELRRELLAAARKELTERQFSNSESYDKAILTLSSAFLALSLTFIKDVLGSAPVRGTWTLYASWIAFAAAIISTVVSLRVSDAALNSQLELIEQYYQHRDESAAEKSSLSRWVDRCNNASGLLFVVGIVLTVIFVIHNFSEGIAMSEKSAPQPRVLQEGHTVPAVQKVDNGTLRRGHSIPQVQKVPLPAPVNSPAQPAGAASTQPVSSGSTATPAQKK
jgi:hypothetical protein